MNKYGWEKDPDARRWRRYPDYRRRWIITSFPVAIMTIRPVITVMVIIPPSVLFVTAVVFFVIFTEGRHHVYTADH
jgi:hypothetical protein